MMAEITARMAGSLIDSTAQPRAMDQAWVTHVRSIKSDALPRCGGAGRFTDGRDRRESLRPLGNESGIRRSTKAATGINAAALDLGTILMRWSARASCSVELFRNGGLRT